MTNNNKKLITYGSAAVVAVILVFMFFVSDGSVLQGNLGNVARPSQSLQENSAEDIQTQLEQIEAHVANVDIALDELTDELNLLKTRHDLSFPTFTENLENLQAEVEVLENRVSSLEGN